MNRAAPRRLGVFLLAGALLVLAGVAWGATARPRSTTPRTATVAKKRVARTPSVNRQLASTPAAKATAPAGAAAMRIFRDPETGQIGPPTAEHAHQIALDAQGKPSFDGSRLPQTPLAGGGYRLDTSGFEDALIVQIDAKGNRVMRCSNDPKAAHQVKVLAPQREDR